MSSRIWGYAVLPLILLTGCVPKVETAKPLPDSTIRSEMEQRLDQSSDQPLMEQWWRCYEDEQLNSMIDQALSEAPGLKSIEARYAQANALIQSVESHDLPHLSAQSSLIRERFSENHIFPPPLGGSTNTQYQAGLSLAYDFDFWNARRSRIQSARYAAMAQRASIAAAKTALADALAEVYLSWHYDERRVTLLESLEKTCEEEHSILEKEYRLGLIDAAALHRSTSALFEIRRRISGVKQQIEGKKESLAVLGGFLPSYIETLKAPHIGRPLSVPLPKEIMLNLLAHRPDVSVAKYTAMSKRYVIDEKKARFYPDITLSGVIGFISFDWVKFIDHSSYVPSGGVALSLPLLDWGERNAALEHSASDYNSSVYDYNQAVVKAANEVIVLLKQSRLIDAQRQFHEQRMAALSNEAAIARRKLSLGLRNKLPYLSTSVGVTESALDGVSIEESEALTRIRLMTALGGGYSDKGDEHGSR